jgi:hypothetical protein
MWSAHAGRASKTYPNCKPLIPTSHEGGRKRDSSWTEDYPQKENTMAAYLSLINFTDQGIRNVKDTVNRGKAAQQALEAAGGRFIGIWWALVPQLGKDEG